MKSKNERKIVLLACCGPKLKHKAPAAVLYCSDLFRKSLAYAQALSPDAIYILSAKYGLVTLDQELEPYDFTLNKQSTTTIRLWSDQVLKQLSEESDLEKDRFVILAGDRYFRNLLPVLRHVELPLEGLGIGKRLQWLNQRIHYSCGELHGLFASLPRFQFPFNPADLPPNGIYILYEAGETAHGTDRIVRIGTHRGQDQLPGRLKEHFVNENKDRSIFRKNIGRALLCRESDPDIALWEIDMTSRDARLDTIKSIDNKFIPTVEHRVTEYIRNNCSFVAFPVADKSERLRLESGIIGTVAACRVCSPSPNWLGRHSPKENIRSSGLWLIQGLSAKPLTDIEYQRLIELTGCKYPAKIKNRPTHHSNRIKSVRSNNISKNRSGYRPLQEFLTSCNKRIVDLTFDQISEILGRDLPDSAHKHRAWWSNQRSNDNRPQARAWMEAGYKVDSVRLGSMGFVQFQKI